MTRATPVCTWRELAAMMVLISLAALAERWANSRTSWATTAKAAPGLAGAGRLDTGIQRQKVGLEGDLIDDAR